MIFGPALRTLTQLCAASPANMLPHSQFRRCCVCDGNVPDKNYTTPQLLLQHPRCVSTCSSHSSTFPQPETNRTQPSYINPLPPLPHDSPVSTHFTKSTGQEFTNNNQMRHTMNIFLCLLFAAICAAAPIGFVWATDATKIRPTVHTTGMKATLARSLQNRREGRLSALHVSQLPELVRWILKDKRQGRMTHGDREKKPDQVGEKKIHSVV